MQAVLYSSLLLWLYYTEVLKYKTVYNFHSDTLFVFLFDWACNFNNTGLIMPPRIAFHNISHGNWLRKTSLIQVYILEVGC